MRPDAQMAMRTALALGPDHCPPDLFAGSSDRVLMGLKAHANTISHARHIALEETFPRTRDLLGVEAFHAVAGDYLTDESVLTLPHALIGRDFPALLHGETQDMARVEWAWLEAHGAPDAPAFDFGAVSGKSAEVIVATRIFRHPAARLVRLNHGPMRFDDTHLYCPDVLLVRANFEVTLTSVGAAAARLLSFLDQPRLLGELLEIDAAATTNLISLGAFTQAPEIFL